MDVLFGPGWSGILLYEVVGYGLEGDFNCKESFSFLGWIGDQVVFKGVIVIDDGMILDCCGFLIVDDEGMLSCKNILIEDGILVGYMQDC